jgi:glycosyltransferase involved in cell wall biosynthesis
MEKVDILLATYNGQEYLREQLNSILNQTFKNFNLIISDDNSTDKTYEILKEYEKKDGRIKLFKQEKNSGVVNNFEFLLENVTNEFFMFADQDDIWKENKIEKSLEKLKSESADLVYTDLEIVNEKLDVIYPSYWKYKGIYRKIKKFNNYEALYLNNFITGCTILARSENISKILPLPKTTKYVLHDYWTALMISQVGKIAYVEEPTIMYRQHKNNNIGSKKKSDQMETFTEVRDLFINVKREHFQAFLDNYNRLDKSKKINLLTVKAYKYFEKLEKTKYICFTNWILFLKLYKYESFSYKMQNFLILNIPILGNLAFKLKKKFSK